MAGKSQEGSQEGECPYADLADVFVQKATEALCCKMLWNAVHEVNEKAIERRRTKRVICES